MRTITKYRANDGSEHATEAQAAARELLVSLVDRAMAPLGKRPKEVEDGKGWIQHDPEVVVQCRDAILDIAEPLNQGFPAFKYRGPEVHPLSIIGRVLSDREQGDPLAKAWNRFCMIDGKGREHQQCYYAYTAGPNPDHVCVEDRRK